jgi:hypothetical protein
MHSSQATKRADIPLFITCDFRIPVFEPGLRHPTKPALVAVPEATVDEDDFTL